MKKRIGAALILLTAAVCLLALRDASRGSSDRYLSSGRKGTVSRPAMPDGTVRVNEAELEDLIVLPGIGETLGQAMLDERESHGDFFFPEDLLSVRGIGTAKLEAIRPWLDLDE